MEFIKGYITILKGVSIIILILIPCEATTAQLTLKKNTTGDKIYIYETKENNTAVLDSIPLLDIFEEWSFQSYGYAICLTWSSSTSKWKTYFVNTYTFDDSKKLVLKEQLWVDDTSYKKLFEKGLTLKCNEQGLSFTFSNGKILSIVLSYDNINKIEFNKLLKTVSEF